MADPVLRQAGLEVVYMLHRETPQARRQRVVPVIVRDTQRTLEIDPAAGVRVLNEAEV